MSAKFRALMIISLVAVLAVVLTAYGSRAAAQTGGDEPNESGARSSSQIAIDPIPGGPGFLSINGGTFVPMNNSIQWAHYGLELINASVTSDGWFIAPVSLPQGATVTKLVSYFFDDLESDLEVMLIRKGIGEGDEQMAIAVSYGAPGYGAASDDSINYAVVDNQIYSYVLIAVIPPGQASMTLVSVRVDYSYPVYEPVVLK